MTVALWRLAADAPAYESDDLTGKGAELTGGRWNRPGRPVVYSASSIALACLETVVHLNSASLPLNRYLVRVAVPDEVWARRLIIEARALPVGWDATPAGRVSLDTGDAWLQAKSSALLAVPSVIVPEEHNVLVNPLHGDVARLSATKLRRWLYDGRLRAA